LSNGILDVVSRAFSVHHAQAPMSTEPLDDDSALLALKSELSTFSQNGRMSAQHHSPTFLYPFARVEPNLMQLRFQLIPKTYDNVPD
jgi:hypothetical protein